MSIRLWRRLAACLTAAVVFCAVLAVAVPALAYTITGSVVDSATGTPIGGASLKIWYWDTDDSHWYITGIYGSTIGDGSYSMSVSDAGLYRVHAYNNVGYAEQWWNLAATESSATTITLPGDTTTGIDFRLVAPKPMPDLTITAPKTCGYASARLSGYLTYGGAPLPGRTVKVLYWSNGGYGVVGSDTTDGNGYWTLAVKPKWATDYQAVHDEDAEYAYSSSGVSSVLPGVYLSKPTGPKTAHTSTTFTSYCYLKPRHASGAYPVYFACQRYESGGWVTKKKVSGKAANATLDGAKASKCTARIRLSKKGSWRIVVVHSKDALNNKTLSSKRYIKVN